MAAKKKTKKKLPNSKALNAAKSKVAEARKRVADIQTKIAELKARGGDKAADKISELTTELGKMQRELSTATKGYATAAKAQSKAFKDAGYPGRAQALEQQAQTLGNQAVQIGSRGTTNQFAAEAGANENILTGGTQGLINTVNTNAPGATQAGQTIVGMNTGEANTALFGANGQPGLVGLLGQAQQQAGAAAQQSQAQQIAGIQGMAGDTRTALQTLSPEVARATQAYGQDLTRAENLAKPTSAMTAGALSQQAGLAQKAMTQAANYKDPTTPQVRQAGWNMMDSARQSERLADQATGLALNYKDPSEAIAKGAISGYQGLAGLQQLAAEDAYARAQRLTPEQMRDADQSARESFAARGMLGSTGSVASEILNREGSLAARRQEAAGLGQLAQQGQAGLTALSSGYETDRLGRRMGLQQNAANLQGAASGQYGAAGSFMSGAETDRLARMQGQRAGAMGLSQAALASQQAVRGEANQARGNLFNSGQFFTNYGLPLMTQGTVGMQSGLGLLSAGLGMSGQGAGIMEAGSNIGMQRWKTEQERAAAEAAAKAQASAGKKDLFGNLIGGAAKMFGGIFG